MTIQILLLALSAWGGQVTVDMLDVGQGDAILIRTEGFTALIDAGPRDANTVQQLRALGVQSLDLVFATHPHADHIGRMPQILLEFDVGIYIDNGMTHTTKNYERLMAAVAESDVDHRTAKTGMSFPFGDEAIFTVLFPPENLLRGTRSDLNSNSIVLRLDHGESSFLFMGDSEAPTEGALLGANIVGIDVLKVAHHGSRHSSTGALLAKLQPGAALISCGANNRYHHPNDEAIERLRTVGALVYRTDLSGNIRAVSDGVGVEILEGTLAELDSVKILPWPTAEAISAVDPPVEPEVSAPAVKGPRLKRKGFFQWFWLERPNAESVLRSEWRAYKRAWRSAS